MRGQSYWAQREPKGRNNEFPVTEATFASSWRINKNLRGQKSHKNRAVCTHRVFRKSPVNWWAGRIDCNKWVPGCGDHWIPCSRVWALGMPFWRRCGIIGRSVRRPLWPWCLWIGESGCPKLRLCSWAWPWGKGLRKSPQAKSTRIAN